MLTLLILRHGKAAPEDQAGSDRDRPLVELGRRAAEFVGQLLREQDLLPERIICSDARRASETAQRVAAAAQFKGRIEQRGELYLADPDAYIAALKELAGDAKRVLVVGHNPSLEQLTTMLSGESIALPPAGLAVCTLPIPSFSQLSCDVRGKLTRQVAPK